MRELILARRLRLLDHASGECLFDEQEQRFVLVLARGSEQLMAELAPADGRDVQQLVALRRQVVEPPAEGFGDPFGE